MPAENLEHPIEGLKDTDQENDEDEMFQTPILFSRKVPNLKKEEEADQGEPLEEMDLSSEGDHGERKLGMIDQGLRIRERQEMAEFIGLGRNSPHDRRRKGNHLEEDEAEEEAEEEPLSGQRSEDRGRSRIESGGHRSEVRSRGRTESGVWRSESGKDAPLDRIKDDDQEDAPFHQGDGPEIHGSKGNGSEDNKKKEDELDGAVQHSLSPGR
jgi:hypothetical protein